MGIFDLVRTANHNLFRNKVRTFLTVLAIFVGSFTIVLNAAINTGVNAFIDEQADSLGGEDYIMVVGADSMQMADSMMSGKKEPTEYNPHAQAIAMNPEQINKLKNIEGIDSDNIYIAKNIPIEYITSADTTKKYNIVVGAMPPGNFHIATAAGRLPDRDAKQYEIMLEPGYAKALGFGSDDAAINKKVTLTVTDPVTNKTADFEATVVGVQAGGVVAVNGTLINPALEEAMYAEVTKNYPAEQKEMAYAVQTRFDNTKYTESEIKQILEDNGFYGITVSDMMGTIRTFFDVIMIVFTIFGGIALLAAAIGIVNTLFMSVEERTREIGLDKALGMSSGKIFSEFAIEAVALGFWGSVCGVAVAMLIGTVVNNAVHAPGGFLEVFPTFDLFRFTLGNILPIILTVMIISFIAGTLPAWKASHKNPIEALRYE